ncbi:MAG: serine/threonine-protein kinase [Kofleriaceae bacterium]
MTPCPHCQTPLQADARFCPACGKAAQQTTPEPHASGPHRAQADLVGKEIAGRFRVLAKIGEGGMGAVYRGEQISLRRAVAIKVLRPDLSANQMLLRRFSAEAEAVAKLDHPNTVKVYDFGQDADGSLFIAMELVDGKPLRAILNNAGPLPPVRAFNIALQVAASLVDAHGNSIVHRDLKPDNVMLVEKGKQRDVVRVLDFGIAKLRDDSRQTQQAMTQAGDMLGTPQYMAPEQIKGEAIDGRTDIYALGCMLFEMVTARLPFEAPTIMAMLSKHLIEAPVPPSQRRPDLGLSPAIDQVVMAALAKEPSQRPANMEIYAEMLAGVLAQLPPDPQWSPQGSRAMTREQSQPNIIPPVLTPTPAPTPAPTPIPPTARVAGGYQPTPSPQPQPAYPQPFPTAAQQQFRPLPKKNNLPLFMIIGAVVLAGAGIAVWMATKEPDKKPAPIEDDYRAKVPVTDPAKKDPGPDPWKTTNDPSVKKPDHWANGHAPPPQQPPAAPKPKSVGTAMTGIPAGAHLVPPAGFTSMPNSIGIQLYGAPDASIVMALFPLPAGTNDPRALAKLYIGNNASSNLTLGGVTKNQDWDMVTFTGTFNGIAVIQYVTFIITDRYRIGYTVQSKVEGRDDDLIGKLVYSGVKLP